VNRNNVIFTLAWENVRFRPVRTLLSILLLALPVTLILTLIGLSNGVSGASAERLQGVGADIIFRPPGSAAIGAMSGLPLPETLVNTLSHEPHVTLATGVGVQTFGVGGFDNVTGIDLDGFTRMSGGFTMVEGRLFRNDGEIVLDRYYATQKHVHAGGKINVLNRDWVVTGIVEPGKLAHIFIPLHELQDLVSATGKVTYIYLKVDDPANIDTVVGGLKAKYEGYPVFSMREMLSLISVDNVPLLKGFINAVIGLGVLIGFAVAFLAMYMAVLQRTREIGIFKSLGATKGFIMSLILAEAFSLGLGGTILGIAFSFGTRSIMSVIQPASLPEVIVTSWWPIAGAVVIGASLLGALYPGMMAVRQDPIEALAYE
jgi:putative ABC transport system permease protein